MDERIYMIMARVLNREASHEEEQELQSWIALDTANQKAFDELNRLWDTAGDILNRPHFDVQAAWAKVRQRILVPASETAQPRTATFINWLRYAIGIAAALAIGVFSYLYFTVRPAMKEAFAASGTREVVLPDQSHVWLKQGSRLRYPASFGKERKVVLHGEGYFEVSKDTAHPFLIDAQSVKVQVLGTSFNVRSNDNAASVYVTTGRVQVHSVRSLKAQDRVVIVPGELAELKEGVLEKRASEEANDLFWKSGVMKFSGKPLHFVVAEISRICMVPVKLDEAMPPATREQSVNITFSREQPEEMLTDLCLITHCQWAKQDKGYLIRAQ